MDDGPVPVVNRFTQAGGRIVFPRLFLLKRRGVLRFSFKLLPNSHILKGYHPDPREAERLWLD